MDNWEPKERLAAIAMVALIEQGEWTNPKQLAKTAFDIAQALWDEGLARKTSPSGEASRG